MIIRKLEAKDYEAYKELFDESYSEYLEFLKREDPKRYRKERHEGGGATRARFDTYVKAGSSFVVEEKGKVIGYVASQIVPFMHGVDKLLWIEYVVVQQKFRKRGLGLALLHKLIDCAKQSSVDRIYTTISLDNEASIKLHLKAGFNVEDRKIASYKIGKSSMILHRFQAEEESEH